MDQDTDPRVYLDVRIHRAQVSDFASQEKIPPPFLSTISHLEDGFSTLPAKHKKMNSDECGNKRMENLRTENFFCVAFCISKQNCSNERFS
jgi:hypothetical protein